jgi:glycosyltransferase involved in cell wall biosynthesis
LLHYLQSVDSVNHYYVLLSPKDIDGWNPKSKRFHKVKCLYKEFTFAEQLGMLWQLRKLHADLVHFPMVQQPILYLNKVVTTMNDLTTIRFENPTKNRLVFKTKQFVYRWVNKIVAHKSAALITYTEYVKNDVAKFAKANSRKFNVINLASDPITDKPEDLPELVDQQFIMYVGRPLPHKNLERLIDAFEKLQEKHADMRLVLAGKTDSNYRRIARMVKRRELTNVVFTDFISEGQLRWLYENCAAYVFPSLSEGFGLPGLEAMNHGAPVVSSNATCLPEVYGDAAHYFDPLDVYDMAKAINDVLIKDTLRAELIQRGRKQVGKYSWERMARQTLDIYNEVLGK